MNNSPELKAGFPEHLRIKMYFSLIKPNQFGRRTSAVPNLIQVRPKHGKSAASESNFLISSAKQLGSTSAVVLHDSGKTVIQTSNPCRATQKILNNYTNVFRQVGLRYRRGSHEDASVDAEFLSKIARRLNQSRASAAP